MDTSKQLIVALEKSDWLDRLLILSGLAFFLLVVLFILKQRIVDRGLRIAFWWTRFLPDVKPGGSSGVQSTGLDMVTALSAATTTASAALTASSLLITSKHPSQAESSDESPPAALVDIPGLSPSALSSPSTYPVVEAIRDDERTTDHSGQRDEL
jgi:protein transport protein SEC20